MSKPSYSTKNQEAAMEKYQAQLKKYDDYMKSFRENLIRDVEPYVGENAYLAGLKLANQTAGGIAQKASGGARAEALAAGQQAGLTKSQAAAAAQNAASKTFADNYLNSLQAQQGIAGQNIAQKGSAIQNAYGQEQAGKAATLSGYGQNVTNASNLDDTKNKIKKADSDLTNAWIGTGINTVGSALASLG